MTLFGTVGFGPAHLTVIVTDAVDFAASYAPPPPAAGAAGLAAAPPPPAAGAAAGAALSPQPAAASSATVKRTPNLLPVIASILLIGSLGCRASGRAPRPAARPRSLRRGNQASDDRVSGPGGPTTPPRATQVMAVRNRVGPGLPRRA